jgi:membrane protein implicated in regulation of membrane protease activity
VIGGLLGAVCLGLAAVVAGGADDSPGLQGIGVLLLVVAVVSAVRVSRRRRGRRGPTGGA